MFPQSLMRLYDGVGAFSGPTRPRRAPNASSNFYAREFLKNNLAKNKHGKTTESPRLPG